MDFYGKITDSAANKLKSIPSSKLIAGAGGASGSETTFASTLQASLAAQTPQENETQEALPQEEPQSELLQEEEQSAAETVQRILTPLTITQDTMYLTPETADTPIHVEIGADGVEAPTPGGPRLHEFIINGVLGKGYYGMDGNGNWGYYADQALTKKLENGGWDTYRSSDGGSAMFNLDSAGRLVPFSQRDESRANQTVILAAGNKAFECEFNDLGYMVSHRPIKTDVSQLFAAQNDPARDQGISGRDLLWHTEGVRFDDDVGETVDTTGFRAATYRDWEEIMDERGYEASAAAQAVADTAQPPADAEPLPAETVQQSVGVEQIPAETEEIERAAAETVEAAQQSAGVEQTPVETAETEQAAETPPAAAAFQSEPAEAGLGGSIGGIPVPNAAISAAEMLFNALEEDEDEDQ